jgi:hypothetical protein
VCLSNRKLKVATGIKSKAKRHSAAWHWRCHGMALRLASLVASHCPQKIKRQHHSKHKKIASSQNKTKSKFCLAKQF